MSIGAFVMLPKIYYIANARMPTERAHGIQLAKMCEAFLEKGVSLELVVPRRSTVSESVASFYGLRRAIPIKKLSVLDVYLYGRVGYVAGSFSFALAYFFYLLAKRMRGERFIIYTTDIDQFSFFLIPFLGVPYFAEIHDAKEPKWPFTFFFRRVCGLIVINRIIKEKICARFVLPSTRVVVHPNGIDLGVFHLEYNMQKAREQLGLPQDKKIVLYVGKFYGWKGLDTLVEAADLLRGDASIQWYLVGDTEQRLKNITHRDTLPPSIRCIAHRTIKEIPLWLSAADVRIALGTKKNEYSYYHTSPMKLFEYMAIPGRGIIAADTPAIKEIVSDDEVVFYMPDNAYDLKTKIERMIISPHESVLKSQNAFERVKGFTWEKRADAIVQFIKNSI